MILQCNYTHFTWLLKTYLLTDAAACRIILLLGAVYKFSYILTNWHMQLCGDNAHRTLKWAKHLWYSGLERESFDAAHVGTHNWHSYYDDVGPRSIFADMEHNLQTVLIICYDRCVITYRYTKHTHDPPTGTPDTHMITCRCRYNRHTHDHLPVHQTLTWHVLNNATQQHKICTQTTETDS